MDKIILGEDPFTIRSVLLTMDENKSSYAILLKSILSFGHNLGIDEVNMMEVDAKLKWGRINHSDAMREILQLWKAAKSRDATLDLLYRTLVITGVQDIADAIKHKYLGAPNDMKFFLLDKIYDLDGILGKPAKDHPMYEQILKCLKDIENPREPIQLVRNTFPEDLRYYISRTLSQKTMKLDPEVFTDASTKDMLFLFKDIKCLHDLEKIAGNEIVQTSGSQLVNVNSRLIILKRDEHFEKICKITSKEVHVIQVKDDAYFWKKSNRSVNSIDKFLANETIELKETELLELAEMSRRPSYVCISDSAGMGKTTLLGNLAKMMKQSFPDNVVLFILLPELVAQKTLTIDSDEIAMKAIVSYLCRDVNVTILFEEMLRSNAHKFDLFLDGYDEVPYDKIDILNEFLEKAKLLKNFRIFVTTRPHFKRHLEEKFGTHSYDILPFNDENQINFLVKYWTNHKTYSAKSGNTLHHFARICLKKLQTKLSDNLEAVAGVPLQCFLLGEVYAKTAQMFSKNGDTCVTSFEIDTIFDMYKRLFDLKFKRLKRILKLQQSTSTQEQNQWYKRMKRHYHDEHVLAAIKSIIPDSEVTLKKYLALSNEIEYTTMYSVGLMEERSGALPKFLHHTFAQYTLAKFLVETMGSCGVSMDLVFNTFIGVNGLDLIRPILNSYQDQPFPKFYKMRHFAVAYFLDQHLREYLILNFLDCGIISRHLKFKEVALESLCKTLTACCCNDLEHLFHLTTDVLEYSDSGVWENKSLKETYFNLLPHLTIAFSTSDGLKSDVIAKFVAADPKKHFYNPEKPDETIPLGGKQWQKHYFYFGPFFYHVEIDNYFQNPSDPQSQPAFYQDFWHEYKYPWIPDCSPLHVAVFRGNFSIAEKLIKIYNGSVSQLKCLAHLCVYHSAFNSIDIVKEKSAILELLAEVAVENNLNWLNERVNWNITPILVPGVHLEHLKKLVELGADINACSAQRETFLHSYLGNITAYKDAIKWALDNKFEQFNRKNDDGLSPLHHAILKFGDKLDDETLDLFNKAKANFNNRNKNGVPLILAALDTQNFQFAKKFLKKGSNINYKTKWGNAAHLVFSIHITGIPMFQNKLAALQWLFDNGFDLINDDSVVGITPLHSAMSLRDLSTEILEYLYAKKANFKATDRNGNSVFFYAILNNQTVEILQKIIDYVGNYIVHACNTNRDTALHVASYSGNFFAMEYIVDRFLDVNLKNKNGNTPLHLISTDLEEIDNFVELLIRKGAKLDVKNTNGKFPITYWIYEGMSYTAMSCLTRRNDLFSTKSDICSQAVTAMITRPGIFPLEPECEQDAFTNLFCMFVEMGGNLELMESIVSVWDNINEDTFKRFDVATSAEFLECLQSCGVVIPEDQVSIQGEAGFQNLVRETNIKVEVVLGCLLKCKQYKSFAKLREMLLRKLKTKHATFTMKVKQTITFV